MNELQVIESREVLGKEFKAYGTIEEPLFLAKDVAGWIEHSDVSMMLKRIDEDEKIRMTNPNNVCGGQMAWFLTEDGLYPAPVCRHIDSIVDLRLWRYKGRWICPGIPSAVREWLRKECFDLLAHTL